MAGGVLGGYKAENICRYGDGAADKSSCAVRPRVAKMLTGGVDVQETCLYWTARAWGNFITSQNIAHGQVVSWTEIGVVMNLAYEKRVVTVSFRHCA